MVVKRKPQEGRRSYAKESELQMWLIALKRNKVKVQQDTALAAPEF
jgi:hypothetical protein